MSDTLLEPNKELFLQALHKRLGAPFCQGGRGSQGYDCVSFITTSLEEAGYTFEYKKAYARTESDLYLQYIGQIAYLVNEPLKGDIIVNSSYEIKHFCVSLGNREIIHCHPKYGKVDTHYVSKSFLSNSLIYRLK